MASYSERPSSIPWPPLLLVGSILAAWHLGKAYPITWPGMDDLPARVVGYGIGAAGVALGAWSIGTMMRARTNVRPDRGADHLITTGPFRRFRNPIYLADAMLLLGIAELTHNVWYAIMVPPFVLLITLLAIIPEERHLEARFGRRYLEYKERSRRWI